MTNTTERPPNGPERTLTLTDFLLARIAEDERVARRATHQKLAGPSHGTWHAESLMLTESDLDTVQRRHVARFDPARVLAECEAKRRIVELWALDMSEPYDDEPAMPLGGQGAEVFYDVLRSLALPYAAHPDYRDEWRP